jgi:hypothetical protein
MNPIAHVLKDLIRTDIRVKLPRMHGLLPAFHEFAVGKILFDAKAGEEAAGSLL